MVAYYKEGKIPTHIVVVGVFENEHSWKTFFCVPFFNEESAVKYRNDMIESVEKSRTQFIILPYN